MMNLLMQLKILTRKALRIKMKLLITFLFLTLSLNAYNYDYIYYNYYLQYEPIIDKYSEKYGLPDLLLLAIPTARENKTWYCKAITGDIKRDKYVYVGLYQIRCLNSNKAEIKRLQKADYNMEIACSKLRANINYFKHGNCDTDENILWGLTAFQKGIAGAKKDGKISEYAYEIYELWKNFEIQYIR